MIDDCEERLAVAEHLNNIRLGKGKRLKLNGGKPPTRSLSVKEEQRQLDVLAALVERATELPSSSERKKTEEFLARSYCLDSIAKTPAPALWEEVSNSSRRLMFRSVKSKSLDILAHALAVYEAVISSPDLENHIRVVSEKLGMKINPAFDLLKATLLCAVDFKTGGPAELHAACGRTTAVAATTKNNRRALSRYLQSLRYLRTQKVRSYNLKDYQKKYGGGVDTWHRLPAKTTVATANEIALEVKSVRLDRDYRDPEADERYYEDIKTGAPLIPKPSGTKWKNMMLRYCVQDLKLAPPDGLVLFVLGDDRTAIGAKEVKSVALAGVANGAMMDKVLSALDAMVGTLATASGPKVMKKSAKKLPHFKRGTKH